MAKKSASWLLQVCKTQSSTFWCWSPLSSGVQVLRSPFWGNTFRPWLKWPHRAVQSRTKAAFWTGMKIQFPGAHVSSSSSLCPPAVSDSNPLLALPRLFVAFPHQPSHVLLRDLLSASLCPSWAFSFSQYMNHLVNVLCIQRAFTYI